MYASYYTTTSAYITLSNSLRWHYPDQVEGRCLLTSSQPIGSPVLIRFHCSMIYFFKQTNPHFFHNMIPLINYWSYIFKEAGASKLGKWHFWLLNIGLPITMIALALEIYGFHAAIPFVAGGSILVVLAIIIFAINIFTQIKESLK
ncbi:hypothetical protein DJ94_1469 [Bacillus pseudomycoides]|nr:hypothetical protein DJ94_1469 [Bacillus pseudomycoides]